MKKDAAKINYKNIESLKEANEIIADNWKEIEEKFETKLPQQIMELIEINKKLLEFSES